MPGGHVCLGHGRLLRFATWLGWGMALLPHRAGNGGAGAGSYENLNEIFYLTCYEKTHHMTIETTTSL